MLFNYEGNSKLSGIYEIRNRLTNKSYIGSAKEFKNRWQGHNNSLKNNVHQNKYLQHSFNKHFEELNHSNFFEFHILEVMEDSTKEERLIKEEYWITQYQENNISLYNNQLKPTKESKIWSSTLEKSKIKMRKITRSVETRKKFSEAKKGNKNPQFGKVGEKSISHKKYENIRLFSPSGEIFTEINCLSEFARIHSLEASKISSILNKKVKSHRGWFLEGTEFKTIKKIYNNAKLLSPDKNVYNISEIKDISLFCKEQSLNHSKLYLVLNKSRPSHKGWTLINSNKKSGMENHRSKVYQDFLLQAPDGTTYSKIECLMEFCRNKGIHYQHMGDVLTGKRKSHKGWHLVDCSQKRKPKPTKIYTGFKLRSPNGDVYTYIKNLKEFAKTNNVEYSNIRSVLNGKRSSQKGWMLAIESTAKDDNLNGLLD